MLNGSIANSDDEGNTANSGDEFVAEIAGKSGKFYLNLYDTLSAAPPVAFGQPEPNSSSKIWKKFKRKRA